MSIEQLLGLEDENSSNGSLESQREQQELDERLNSKDGRHGSDSEEMSGSGPEALSDEGSLSDQESLHEFDKPLSMNALKEFEDRVGKTGVVYLSRIPPFMKHTKLRTLLSEYGQIGRIYLNPEDPKVAARRKKYKNNKRANFTEGWVEFMDKSVARSVANYLNNNIIGGKKRGYYHDDIWNIKYLPKFKWNNLSEQLAYELKVREQKVRNEMAQAKRETNMYMKNVNQSKMIAALEAKNAKRKLPDNEDAPKKEKVNRQFKQRKVVATGNGEASELSSKKAALLARVFS